MCGVGQEPRAACSGLSQPAHAAAACAAGLLTARGVAGCVSSQPDRLGEHVHWEKMQP